MTKESEKQQQKEQRLAALRQEHERLKKIHHRQPLVLDAGDEENWLDGSGDQAAALCKIAPASWFNWYRVSPDVGKVALDHPDLVTPLDGDEFLAAKANQGDLFN